MKVNLRYKIFCLLLILAVLCGIAAACSSAVVYAPEQITMYQGEQMPLGAAAVPFGSSGEFVYFSSDSSVVSVSSTGIITAHTKGEATITTKFGGSTAETLVKVLIRAVGISVEESLELVAEGDSIPLRKVTCTPEGATAEITWESSDEEIVAVVSGLVSGVSAGSAEITGSYEQEGIVFKVSYPVVVLKERIIAVAAQEGLLIEEVEFWSGGCSIFAQITDTASYASYLDGLDTVSYGSGIQYYADLFYGYIFVFGEEGQIEIRVHDKARFNMDTAIPPQYRQFEGIYFFRAELRTGGYRLIGVSGLSRTEVVEIFENSLSEYGGAELPTGEIVYALDINGTEWLFVVSLDLTAQDGAIFMRLDIFRAGE